MDIPYYISGKTYIYRNEKKEGEKRKCFNILCFGRKNKS